MPNPYGFSFLLTPKQVCKPVIAYFNEPKIIDGNRLNTRRKEGVIHQLMWEQEDNKFYIYDKLAADYIIFAIRLSRVSNISYASSGALFKEVITHFCQTEISKANTKAALDHMVAKFNANSEHYTNFITELVTVGKIWVPYSALSVAALPTDLCKQTGVNKLPPLVI